MTDQEIFELGTFIRAYFKKHKVAHSMPGIEVYEFLSRADRWRNVFANKYDFYALLNSLQDSNRLSLLMCCQVEMLGSGSYNKRWRFYGPSQRTKFGENNSVKRNVGTDLYKSEKNKVSKDGTLLRSYQEVYIYNALRRVPGLSVWYELPLKLGNGQDLLPDFTIGSIWDEKGILYWEHFGYGGRSYKSRTKDKLMMYRNSGIHDIEKGGNLIRTYYYNEESFRCTVEEAIQSIKDYFSL